MGIGGALIMPATLSIIANVFPARSARKAIAIWSAMAAVGIGLGPLAGGLLLEWFDWQSVFMVNVPFASLALALGFSSSRRAGTRSRAPSTSSARGSRSRRRRARLRDHRGARAAAGRPLVLGGFGRPSCCGARSSPGSSAREPMLEPRVLPQPALQRRLDRPSASRSSRCSAAIFAITQYLQFAHGYSALRPARR